MELLRYRKTIPVPEAHIQQEDVRGFGEQSCSDRRVGRHDPKVIEAAEDASQGFTDQQAVVHDGDRGACVDGHGGLGVGVGSKDAPVDSNRVSPNRAIQRRRRAG
jgi:hypothetical protein